MTTTQKPIPTRRNINDRPAGRAGGMPQEDLPPLPNPPAPARSPLDDTPFTRGPARRPAPPVADALLQWATGLPTTDRRMYAGWLIEAGKRADLDEAMGRAGYDQVSIRHGSGNVVTHWAIERADVLIIAEGVQSIGEMRGTWQRYGIAFAWRAKEGRMQSHLRCRAFLPTLLHAGFAEPLLLTVKGTVTGDLIAALMLQYEVLDAVDAFRRQAGRPPLNPPLYACSIPLGPGAEVTRGSGSATKEIAPIVAQIPTPITKEYILAHWIRPAWVPLVEGLLDQTIAWSETTSRLIAAGEEVEDGG